MEPPKCSAFFHLFLFTTLSLCVLVRSGDFEALMALKLSIDSSNSLQWQGRDACKWQGIKECMHGRVTKLVLEHLSLSGELDERNLNQLDQLRVLSFKGNSIGGQIPDLSGLHSLKSIFLNDNNFSGEFPDSLSLLHRLKVIVLSGNRISGIIPASLLNLRRLYILHLQDNELVGEIKPLNQSTLRFLNVSNNQLSGQIPVTPPLVRFNASSFSGNIGLCGEQIHNPCSGINGLTPSMSPAYPIVPVRKHLRRRWKIVAIIAASVGGFVTLIVVLVVLCLMCKKMSRRSKSKSIEVRGKSAVGGGVEGVGEGEGSGGGDGGGKKGGVSWEGEGLGSLVFSGPGNQQMSYSLEDLLKASAETLGRGTVGSTYKAVMESGFIVTVKRLKDSRYPRLEEFRRHMEVLGRLTHPNLVPLRAYFQAKEERLLVYDYFPNGSLFSLIHGSTNMNVTVRLLREILRIAYFIHTKIS
ncbi:inactive leucine-rich repeat receptor-like serine/threonine-protein kinase At1g60630 isoform X1 [Actinidia eriantha]|uniref:inactive leucine-rich repeat receptor-like serine/threonine-protein kinase At1g60630 isoform X1 n=1 Tax=Actinidia eriantha TaxID=165200 RepID=UPI00258FDABF|nr:inactive leucine-rich repeat receptor-like serine/threonine-protein kinase At1g60630 isoform X1 [Actinidia eriantha]